MKRVVVVLAGLAVTAFAAGVHADPISSEGGESATPGASAASAEPKVVTPVPMGLPFHAIGPVARVGRHDVTAGEFNEEMRKLTRMRRGWNAPHPAQYQKKVLDQVILDKLVSLAIARTKVSVAEERVDAALAKLEASFEKSSPGGGRALYVRMGLSREEVRESFRRSLLLKEVLRGYGDVEASAEEIEVHYEENRGRYEEKAQVRASHILFKASGDDEERAMRAKIAATKMSERARQPDVEFGSLAIEHSEGPTARKGGDLGWFPAGRMVPPFDEEAFRLKPGEVSRPVKTRFGWHVIKVFDRKPARTIPLEEVRDSIRDALEATKLKAALRNFESVETKRLGVQRFVDNIVSP